MKSENLKSSIVNRQSSIEEGFNGEILRDVALRDYTSLRIGGKTDCLFIPADPLSLKGLIDSLTEEGIGYTVIGGGTNLLITDEGVEGVFISLRAFQKMEVVEDGEGELLLFVQSGLPLQRLVSFCREEGLTGVDGLTGIPGTLGGAIFGNAGAYGYEIMDAVERVTVMEKGGIRVIKRADINATYRCSGFSSNVLILGSHLRLKRGDRDALRKRMDGFLQTRKATQPIGQRSAGSVFKNPPGEAAGRLIDEAGCKGMRLGDIEVSSLHANFFINKGAGKSGDFLSLMETVADRVNQRFGIVLEPEIRIIGKR